jgi:hypothetical protein
VVDIVDELIEEVVNNFLFWSWIFVLLFGIEFIYHISVIEFHTLINETTQSWLMIVWFNRIIS